MTTSADVIAAINQRRTRLTLRPEMPGMLPTGWQDWLDAMPRVDGHSEGALALSLVDAFAQRPLRSIPRAPSPLGRWQSISRLLQQRWEPDLRDERGMRIVVGAVDILLHMILIILLLWLMYLHFLMPPPPPSDDAQAVQVEFIGHGNVSEGGGALAAAGAESAPAAAAPATVAAHAAPASGKPDAAIASVPMPQQAQVTASNEAPQRARESSPPASAEAAQPLQVSEVRVPEPQSFQLPTPKRRDVPMLQVQLRDIQPSQQVEAIVSLQPQPVRILKPREVQAELRTPQLQQQVQAIEVPEPQRLATLPARAVPTQPTRSVEVPQLRGEVREIPALPGGAPTPSTHPGNGVAQQANPASGAGGERGNAPAAGPTSAGKGQGAQPARQGSRGVTSTGAGAGPGIKAAPGGWPGPAKSDDWGASNRNVAGTGTHNGGGKGNGNGRKGDGKPGLFNADGSPRLSDDWTKQSGIDIDRAGKWLSRPGLEYRGTRFDRYWIPGGTLLEEWVRKGIKQISIPIPGTGKSLQCVISLLQLGGGCIPVDPDVNEQPARARPPPDIPFKPQLQEDNGSVKP